VGAEVTDDAKDGKPITVVLTCSDAEPTRTPGRLTVFTPGQRALRTLMMLGITIGATALIAMIPIIHLIGVPLVLVVGIGVAIRQARSVARLAPMHAACPKCGESNSFGGGIGFRTATGPIERRCEECRRGQTLTFEDAGG
jgi:hypothetical protein